tara:strand:+ start:30 stop:218 length:189 start_codon:yes stop_codon:yes gene_type:complete
VDHFSEAFARRLKELKEDHINHLSGGSVATHDEYRHICGIIRGISIAELEAKELTSSDDDVF